MNTTAKRVISWDLIFALSIILITMTNLRVGGLPIGLGEFFLLVWFIREISVSLLLNKSHIDRDYMYIILYWLLFFLFLLLGTLVSLVESKFTLSSAIYDFLAYFLSFMVCYTLTLKSQTGTLEKKVRLILTLGVPTFLFLSLWWKIVGPNFGSLEIAYGNTRFTGGASNPNQLGLFMIGAPVLALFFLKQDYYKKKYNLCLFWIFIFISSIYIGHLTLSDSLYGTWIIALGILFFLKLYRKVKFPLNLFILNISLVITVSFIVYYPGNIDLLVNGITDWFTDLDQDGSRAILWYYGIKTGLESPIFGFGPGPQVVTPYYFYTMEAHNVYIDVFTQTGILGILLFGFLIIKIISNVNKKTLLLILLLCVLFYSVAHFPLRQPIFWVYIMFLATYKLRDRSLV